MCRVVFCIGTVWGAPIGGSDEGWLAKGNRDSSSAFRELSLCCRASSLGGRNQPDSFYWNRGHAPPAAPTHLQSASGSKTYVLKVSLPSWCVGFIVYNSIGLFRAVMGPRGRNAFLCGCPAEQEAGMLHSVTGTAVLITVRPAVPAYEQVAPSSSKLDALELE